MLAFEPPHFAQFGSGAATIGGAVAAGLSGPRRAAAGAVRDFVLGVRMMDGRGEDLAFGGRVMKNVAGYDVSRVMAGALGTLGVILEVSLKVLPLPVAETTLRFEMPRDKAVEAMNRWAGRAAPDQRDRVHRRRSRRAALGRGCGGERGVRDARRRARRRRGGAAFLGRDPRADRSVLRRRRAAVAARRCRRRRRRSRSRGASSWSGAAACAGSRAARRRGRSAMPRHAPAGTPRCSAAATSRSASSIRSRRRSPRIHQRLKAEFDPHGVLNRGRLYPEL